MIIPVWNDTEALRQFLSVVARLKGIDQIIIADVSDDDSALRAAAEIGATVVRCEKPNRGGQMNAGAAVATGDLLVFQHVDVELGQPHVDALRHLGDEFVGGAFHRVFDEKHRWRKWLVPFVRFWNRHIGALYGDQTIFVRRGKFIALGGYKSIPLMEDIEFSRRLRKTGRIILLDPPVWASARRHQQRGSLYVTAFNMLIITLFSLGVSPYTLHRWYYRGKSAAKN